MDSQSRTDGDKCRECGGRLRNGFFAGFARRGACSWVCYLRHMANACAMSAQRGEWNGVRARRSGK